jgi:heme/copper-type cytochrome/quinol oxidase subunit 2
VLRQAVRHRRLPLALSAAGLLVCALAGTHAWGRTASVRFAAPARPPGTAPGTRPAPAPRRAAPDPQNNPSFTIIARKYEFSPARIRVHQDDLVKITLVAEDIPHSFTLDALKISKRAAPGHPAVFDFRAELPDGTGDVTFPFYCNLSIDEGCRRMRGELVIERKR